MPATVTPSLTMSMPTPFIVACSLGLTDVMAYLLAHGADALDDKSDICGHSPLMMICENGQEEATAFLLQHVRKQLGEIKLRDMINKKSLLHHLWSCLHFAASTGQFTICQLLLDSGAFIGILCFVIFIYCL